MVMTWMDGWTDGQTDERMHAQAVVVVRGCARIVFAFFLPKKCPVILFWHQKSPNNMIFTYAKMSLETYFFL